MRNVCRAIILACLLAGTSASSQEATPSGKVLTLVVGFGPATGYDLYARILGRHMSRHLAGRPNIITQNMPGAGGFAAASYLYNSAPRDGSVIGMIDQASPLSQSLGVPGFRADVAKFSWIGRITTNAAILFSRHTASISSIKDAFTREVIISAPGQNSRIISAVLKNLLGMKLRILTGYRSSAESQLAMERKEIDAMTMPWSVLRAEKPEWLREKWIDLLLQMGTESHKDLKEVPLITSLARNEEEASVLTLASNDSRVGRSIVAPPDLPDSVLGELRRGFMATMVDPAFVEEIARAGLDLVPMSGQELQQMIQASVKVSPEVVERLRAVSEINR